MADVYYVWDPGNRGPDSTDRTEADSPEHAAEIYASDDVDGSIDGIYSGGHALHVRDESGKVHRVEVTVDYDPTYHGELLPDEEQTNDRG